jgi:hypothetical protein
MCAIRQNFQETKETLDKSELRYLPLELGGSPWVVGRVADPLG